MLNVLEDDMADESPEAVAEAMRTLRDQCVTQMEAKGNTNEPGYRHLSDDPSAMTGGTGQPDRGIEKDRDHWRVRALEAEHVLGWIMENPDDDAQKCARDYFYESAGELA